MFLSLTKGIHVEGNLKDSVQLQLPLEIIDEAGMSQAADLEFINFHIKGEDVEIEKDQRMRREGNVMTTYVKSFST